MFRIFRSLLALALILVPVVASAQGLLVDNRPDHQFRLPRPIIIHPHPRPRPIPPQSYKIQELKVDTTVTDQVAKVQVSQSFVNTGSRQMEVSFIFPLPYDGAVDSMTFMVDGKEYPAQLLNAKMRVECTKDTYGAIRIRRCWNGWERACSRPVCSQCHRAQNVR